MGKNSTSSFIPFFSNIEKVTSELQGGQARHIRIGASSIILRDHLPSLLRDLRKKFPTLKISLREGYPAHLENLLAKEEIDLAVTLMEKKTATGIHTRELLELPMVLLVEKSSGITSAEQLWKRDKIEEPLICLPPGELLCKQFQQKLTEIGVDWFPSIEASSARPGGDLRGEWAGNRGVGGDSKKIDGGKYAGAAVAGFSAGGYRGDVARADDAVAAGFPE